MTQTEAFRREGHQLREELADSPGDEVSEDIQAFVTAVLRYTASTIPVSELDAKATRRERFETDRISNFIEVLRGCGAEAWSFEFPDGRLVGAEVIGELRKELAGFHEIQERFGRFEGALRLRFVLDGKLHKLLLASTSLEVDLTAAVAVFKKHLHTLSDKSIETLWASVQQEVDQRSEVRVVPYDEIFEAGFFGTATVDEMRSRIADYVVVLRPRAVARMIKENGGGAAQSVGVASTLAYSVVEPLDDTEERILLCLASIMGASEPYTERPRLLGALGLEPSAWIGRSYGQRYRPLGKTAPPSLKRVLRLVERLLLYIETYVSAARPIEQALLQYKLGLEVMLPDSRPKTKKERDELRLQRQVCKFLIERGFRAYGTKFGQQEVDILAQAPELGQSYVIEAKVYTASVSPEKIRSNLTQLQSYVDTAFQGAKGVLLLFNLTDTLIKAERRWISSQYWILPINLGEASPSKRKASIEISPGTDGRLVDVVRSSAAVAGTRRTRTSKAARRQRRPRTP